MFRIPVLERSIRSWFFVTLILFAALFLGEVAEAGDTGTLTLKVQRCLGSWIAGAAIDVTIYRPGTGNVDSGSGTSGLSGYVEIVFDDLEVGDQALVTVTPVNEDPDSGHIYYWINPDDREVNIWDLTAEYDDTCDDGWYDQSRNIILCIYD